MANPIKIIKNGIINENPTFVQVIGMCPTLAVTSSAINGIGMGLSTTAVPVSYTHLPSGEQSAPYHNGNRKNHPPR